MASQKDSGRKVHRPSIYEFYKTLFKTLKFDLSPKVWRTYFKHFLEPEKNLIHEIKKEMPGAPAPTYT